MPIKTITRCPGLFTAPNELGSVPDGALVEAKNVVIRHKDVIEPRRGQTSQSYSFGSASDRAKEIAFYGSTAIIQYGTNTLARDTGSAWTDYSGTYTPPDATNLRMKFVEMNENLYFTTTKGIYRLDQVTGTPVLAGGPKTADLNGVLSTTGSSGFLASGSRVAYRVTLCFKDANGAIHEGPPSGRAFATASGGSRNVSVVFPLPSGLTTSYFFRLYRTAQFPSDVDPGDEMNLVYERYLTASEVSALSVTFTDATPDEFRGQPLHTNPNTGDGITQANSPPPFAKDIALWDNRLWFGNTKQLHRAFLQLIGVGSGALGGSGLRLGDTLTIDGNDYRASTTNDAGTGEFNLVSGGSAANNIIDTTRNLIQVINSTTGAGVRAFYLSGPDDAPGKFVIESKALDDAQWAVTLNPYDFTVTDLTRTGGTTVTVTTSIAHGFAVGDTFTLAAGTPSGDFATGTYTVVTAPSTTTFTYTNAGSNVTLSAPTTYTATRLTPTPALAWTPEIPTSGTTLSSDNDEAPHRVYYSKIQQPEAVPLLNYIDVGAKNKAIQRIVPLRDGLFVFKEDGVFVVSGSGAYRVDLLDNTIRLLAWDSAVPVAGTIYAYTNQGVVQVNESGVGVVSQQIDDQFDLQKTFLSSNFNIFGAAHETDGLYSLWFQATVGLSGFFYTYVYSVRNGVWTRWDGLTRNCGRVHPSSDLLYMGRQDSNYIAVERKNYWRNDYHDEEYAVNVTAWDADTLTATLSSVANAAVGDMLEEAGGNQAVIISITGSDVVLSSSLAFSLPESCKILKAYECWAIWAPDLENTRTRESHLVFRALEAFRWYAGFTADHFPATLNYPYDFNEVTYADRTTSGSSASPNITATLPYLREIQHRRVMLPRNEQVGPLKMMRFRTKEANCYWALIGRRLVYEAVSERTMLP